MKSEKGQESWDCGEWTVWDGVGLAAVLHAESNPPSQLGLAPAIEVAQIQDDPECLLSHMGVWLKGGGRGHHVCLCTSKFTTGKGKWDRASSTIVTLCLTIWTRPESVLWGHVLTCTFYSRVSTFSVGDTGCTQSAHSSTFSFFLPLFKCRHSCWSESQCRSCKRE